MWQCVCVRVYVCMCVCACVWYMCREEEAESQDQLSSRENKLCKDHKARDTWNPGGSQGSERREQEARFERRLGMGQTPPSRTPWVEFGLNTMRVLLYIFKVSHWVQCGKWTGRGQKCKWRNQLRDCTPGKRRLWVPGKRLRAVRWLLNYFQNTLWRAHFWEGH